MSAPEPEFREPPESQENVFVGRQPIYGRRLELYAYELLYRGGHVDFADFTEGDRATSQVLLNTFTEFGIERVVGGHLAFVNLTRGFIVGEYPLPVPRNQVVLEVLEDIQPDEEVIEGLRRLRRRGFRIALDDFVSDEQTRKLIELADIIKIDVLGLGEDEIRRRYEELSPHGVKLLAEKIETREQFEFCRELGFDYFQGYFLAKPNILSGSSMPPSGLNLLRLMAEFRDPNCDFDRVIDIVSQDVTLSYKLLRHINAAIYGMPRTIVSIRETVIYLGLSTVKNLACLFMLSNQSEKPHSLVVTSMMRGKMCELLASEAGLHEESSYFTVGLFSTLEALLDAPMAQILARIPLGQEIKEALLNGGGPMGEALACTVAYERGEWSGVDFAGLDRGAIKRAFLGAVRWVDEVDQEMVEIAG